MKKNKQESFLNCSYIRPDCALKVKPSFTEIQTSPAPQNYVSLASALNKGRVQVVLVIV